MLRLVNAQIYYYESVWEGGRPRNRYRGKGLRAVLNLEADREKREERLRVAAEWKAEGARLDKVEAAVATYSVDVNRVVSWAMESAGYHRSQRYKWRRKRMKPLDDRYVQACYLAFENKLSPDEIKRFRKMMTESARAYQSGGPGEFLKLSLGRVCFGDTQLGTVVFDDWFAQMFAEIAGPNPGPLERMLTFRVVCCWAVVNSFEKRHFESIKDLTIAQSESQQKRIDRAHRRFLSAIKALADIRRLPAPVLQSINVTLGSPVGAQLAPPPSCRAIDAPEPEST
jgi:hypothetical protein